MATTITIAGTDIDYRDFSVQVPTSPVDLAPSASVTTTAETPVAPNDDLTITIDGTAVFEGKTRSGGTVSDLGGVDVQAAHASRDLFEETVSVVVADPTALEVLQTALGVSSAGGTFSIDWSGTVPTLGNDYDVDDRSIKRIFRDMMDRTGRVWWVEPAGTTIHVEDPGGRGLWQAIDTTADGATLRSFDSGNVDSVRNAVTVVGTGEEQVRATAEDSTSISTYGRRPGNSPYNVGYVTTQAEALDYAQALLVPDPLPEGTLVAGSNVGDVTQPLTNRTVDVTDDGKNVDADGLIIESQTIEQGVSSLQLGSGTGVSVEELNRKSKSQGDVTEPGSVYDSDRIADGAVTTSEVEALAITETEIADGSISTPKLQANAITANKIDVLDLAADTITVGETDSSGNPIDSAWVFENYDVGGDTVARFRPTSTTETIMGSSTQRVDIYGRDVDMQSVTLSGLSSMRPAVDDQGTIGNSTLAFAAIYAHEYLDASDNNNPINDGGGDVLADLHQGARPPTACRPCDDDGEERGLSLNRLSRHLWDVCGAQQERIEELEQRLSRLEEQV